MGNAVAAALGEQPKKEVRLTVAQKQTLTDLGFGDKELQALKKYFQRLDENRSGIVSLEMFSEKIGIIAQFVERIFDITNGERGGYLPFMDFALSLWNFCTLDDSELPAALFQCYDRDSNGTLSVAELSALSKDLTPEGRTLGPKLRQALKKFDEILEKQEKMRYEHNMAKAKQRLQSAAGGGSHELGAEPELDDPAEIRISPEFLLNFLKQNAALGQPLQQFHVLARQDILGNRTWHNIRQKFRLPLLQSKCDGKKGREGIKALREHLYELRKSAVEEDKSPDIHPSYMDLTDSDEEDNDMRSARVKLRE